MDSFLWYKVSESEKQEIKKNAKQIIDSFSKKLAKIKFKEEESLIKREKCERQEKNDRCDSDFSREIMFKNSPDKNKDFIIAEKKKW